MMFAPLFLADLGTFFRSWNTYDSYHSSAPTVCQTLSLILSTSVKVGITTSTFYLRNQKLWEIKWLIQNQTVQMKSWVLLAYQSGRCLAWVSPFLSPNVGVFIWKWKKIEVGQWFSPISASTWFFKGKVVVEEKNVQMTTLNVEWVCLSCLPSDFTQRHFAHKGLCLLHSLCAKYCLGKKIASLLK